MGDGRAVFAWIQLLGEGVERQRVLAEVVDVEDGLGVGEVEALEVGVETRLRRAKVWDAGRGADTGARLYRIRLAERKAGVDARPHHDDDALGASILDVLGDGFEGAALERDGRRLVVHETRLFLAHPGVSPDLASVFVLAAALVCVAPVLVLRLAATVLVFATYGGDPSNVRIVAAEVVGLWDCEIVLYCE